MADYLVAAIVVAAVVTAALLIHRRSVEGSACCGTGAAAPRRSRVADRNKAHYPYVAEFNVGGMTCTNCAIRVENALNGLPGTWASVSFDTGRALVRTKEKPNVDAIRTAVGEAGYVLFGKEL